MIRFLSKTPKGKLSGVALLRLDFNTEDDWRLQAALPTVRLLQSVANSVVVVSHKGRPLGREMEWSLAKDALRLTRLLHKSVQFIPHFRFEEIKSEIHRTSKGAIFLLENIRFLKEEMTPEPELARKLASLADYFVNDAFAVSHREEDSVTGVEEFLPSYAGLGLEEEIATLERVSVKPKKPLVVILGGGKAEDKLGVIQALKTKADAFLLGGAAANTILALRGIDVGNSKRDENPKDKKALQVVAKMRKVIAPLDWKVKDGAILDIGPKAVEEFADYISEAKTILWSGPMGRIEEKPFDEGNLAIVKAVVANKKALSVTGGGETVMFLKKHKLDKKFGFISTGGGAMLEFLAGKKLPGIEALKNTRRSRGN